jgi:hypothetical protein
MRDDFTPVSVFIVKGDGAGGGKNFVQQICGEVMSCLATTQGDVAE